MRSRLRHDPQRGPTQAAPPIDQFMRKSSGGAISAPSVSTREPLQTMQSVDQHAHFVTNSCAAEHDISWAASRGIRLLAVAHMLVEGSKCGQWFGLSV